MLGLEDVEDVEADCNQKLTLPLVKTVYGDDVSISKILGHFYLPEFDKGGMWLYVVV